MQKEKVYAVVTVARQIEGEFVFIRSEKAFLDQKKADEEKNIVEKMYRTSDGKFKSVKLTTPHGEAECFCEVGVFELELN